MTDPLVLSKSSLNTFLRCPQQWEYAYVRRIKSPPSVRQTLGIAAHTAVETNFRQKITSEVDLPENDVLDAFSTAYDAGTEDIEKPEEDIGKAKDSGLTLLTKHHREVAPGISPLMVEEPVQYTINGIAFSGYLDLVDVQRRLRDLKTTARSPTVGNHAMEMTGYAVGYREKTGEVEQDVVLDYLVRVKDPKKQYQKVEWGGPVDDHAINVFAKQVGIASTMIEAGLFPATGVQSQACSWCGYTAICPAYRGARK